MKKAPQSLELLADALDARQMLNEAEDKIVEVMNFQRKIARALLQQVAQDFPDAVALEDGRSILVMCARVDPELAVMWRELRGEHAWRPTKKHRFPLAASLNVGALGNAQGLRMSDEKALKAFISDGMQHAMPLSEKEAATWKPGRLAHINKEQHAMLVAQEELLGAINYPYGNDLRKMKLKLLSKAGGAIPYNTTAGTPGIEDMVLAGALPPTTLLIGKADLDTGEWMPWWKHWIQSGDFSSGIPMVALLSKHGIEIDGLMEKVCQKETIRLIDGSRLAGPIEDVMAQLNDIQNHLKDGHFLEEDGVLLWHKAVMNRPDLLSHIVKQDNPDKSILLATSTRGIGIWDAIGYLLGNSISVPNKAFNVIKKIVDPTTNKGGFIWQMPRYASDNGAEKIIDIGLKHSHLLLGDQKTQQQEAVNLLKEIADSFGQSGGWWIPKKLQVVFDPRVPIDCLCPEAKAALYIAQQFLAEHPKHNELLISAPHVSRVLPFDLPDVSAAWLRSVQKALEVKDHRAKPDPQRARFIAQIEYLSLLADPRLAEHQPCAQGRKRRI